MVTTFINGSERAIQQVSIDCSTTGPVGEAAMILLGVGCPHGDRSQPLFEFLRFHSKRPIEGETDDANSVLVLKATVVEQNVSYDYRVRIEMNPPHRILDVEARTASDRGVGGFRYQADEFGEVNGAWYPKVCSGLVMNDGRNWEQTSRTVVSRFEIVNSPIDFSDIDKIERNPKIRLVNCVTGEQRSGKTTQEMLAFARQQVQDTRALVAGQEDVRTPPTVLATTATDPWTWVPIVASAVMLVLLLGFAWHQRRYSR